MPTTKRALLLLVADIKKNIKMLNLPDRKLDDIYMLLHDVLGTLVGLNYKKTRR